MVASTMDADLSDICNHIDSTKITERKKRVEELRILLQNPVVLKHLDKNSDNNASHVQWNNLYQAVHKSVVKEANKYFDEEAKGKIASTTLNAVNSSSNLLLLIASKANNERARLSCRVMVCSTLEILENSELRKLLSTTYINILDQFILPKKCYWGEITSLEWIDMVDTVLPQFYESNNSEKGKSIVLNVLNQLCLHGSRLADFFICNKKLLTAHLPQMIREVASYGSPLLQCTTVQLAVTVCQKLKKEGRLFICQFGEEILPCIIKMTGCRTGDVRKLKEIISILVLELISVHHPCDTLPEMPGSMVAITWNSWITCLNSLFICLCNEIDNLCLSGPSSSYHPIITLAVTVAKLVMNEIDSDKYINEIETDVISFSSSAAKRPKLKSSISEIIENVRWKKKITETWPWLMFLELLISKYPEMFQETDYISLLRLISDYLGSCSDKDINLGFWRCAKGMLLAEKIVKEKCRVNEIVLNNLWAKIWSTALRDLSRTEVNNYGSGCHMFVQAAIKTDNYCVQIQPLLDIFSNQEELRGSMEELITLKTLCTYLVFPESYLIKKCLLKYLLEGCCALDHDTAVLHADVIFGLLLKSKCPLSFKDESTSSWDKTDMFYMTLYLENIPTSTITSFTDDQSEINIIEDKIACQEFINLTKSLKWKHSDPKRMLLYGSFFYQIDLHLSTHCLSIAEEITRLFGQILDHMWTCVETKLKEYNSHNSEELISELYKFISQIQERPQIISGRDITALAKLLFEIIEWYREKSRNEFNSSVEDTYEKETTMVPKLDICILKILVDIGFVESICLKKNAIHNNILKFCSYSINVRLLEDYQVLIEVLKLLIQKGMLSDVLLENVINVLKALCKDWYKHDEFADIISVLEDCIQLVYKSGISDIQKDFCKLVGYCSEHLFSKNYGPSMVTVFVKLIGNMVKVDEECRWHLSIRRGDAKVHIRFHILQYLKSKSIEVRAAATEFLPHIFENQEVSQLKQKMQCELFKEIITITFQLFNVEGNLLESDIEREGITIACSVLRIFITLIVSSDCWRRKSLFYLFKFIYEKNINKILVQKVLKQIKNQMKLSNVTVLLEQNLDFIALTWYTEYNNFKNFPYFLLSCCSRKMFLSEYKTCLVPILIEKGDEQNLKEICEELEFSQQKVVEDCFPEAISSLLPKLGSPEARHNAQAMYTIIQQIIGGEKLKELLSEELDKVLVCLFEKLHDEQHLIKLCGVHLSKVEFPQRTTSHIFFSDIVFTLGYLQKTSPDSSIPLLEFLCNEYSNHIHHLLHSLFTNIIESATFEIRLLCFHQYVTLCDYLVESVSKVGAMAGYIIRNVVHRLLHLLESDLTLPSLGFLQRFLSRCISSSAVYIDDQLHVIVPKLVLVSTFNTIEAQASLQILNLLMVNHKDVLPGIRDLDPLPNEEIFYRFLISVPETNLSSEIEHFLKVGERQKVDLSTRVQGLQHLHQQLINRKTELDELYSDLKNMRGFVEDCEKSILHRIISSLISLTTSHNAKIRETAAKCLGEFGPRDLKTLALKSECNQPLISLSSTLLSLLLPLMVHNDTNLSVHCCNVLRALLSTKEGDDSAGKLTHIQSSYLIPFANVSRKIKRSYSVQMSENTLKKAMENWCPDDHYLSHEKWIAQLVTSLLSSFTVESSFFRLLIPVVQYEIKVAEAILPYITYIIIKEMTELLPVLEQKLNLFFDNHFSLINKQTDSIDKESKSIYMNRASLQCMLSVVNFYRQKDICSIQKLKHTVNLNFLHIAEAAQYCRAYFTSILYSELWTHSALSSLEEKNVKQRSSPLELISEHFPENGFILRHLLWEAYIEIGESDAIYGCGNVHLHDIETRIKHYKHLGFWPKIIDECQLFGSTKFNQDLVLALKMSGHYVTAMKVCENKIEYDCAWRLGNWELDVPFDDASDYNSLLYGALKAVKMKDNATAKMFVIKARELVLESLKHASLEVANSIYLSLSRLQALSEIELFEDENAKLLQLPLTNDYLRWELIEPILVQRGLLLDPAPQLWLNAAQLQASYSYSQLLALSYLYKIMEMGANGKIFHEAKLEEAQLVWSSGENQRAKYLLKIFIATNDNLNNTVLSSALLTYGKWMAETKNDKPTTIIQKYFQKAASLCDATSKQRLAAADCLARYADSEFQRMSQYINSGKYASKIQNIDDSNRTYKELRSEFNKRKEKISSDDQKALLTYEGQAKIDKDETDTAKKEFTEYLKLAVREYLKCLIIGDGDSNDLKMFRLVSLWFDNKENLGLQTELDSAVNKVATYKFLSVLPQLAVRIATPDDSHFISTLQQLLIRCCEEHPHHSLPLLLALVNSEKDEEYINSSKNKRKKKLDVPRVLAAKKIVEILIKRGKFTELVKLYQSVSTAYISFANYEVSRNNMSGDYKIPAKEPIGKIMNYSAVPCITLHLQPNKSGNYSKIIGIEKFSEMYTMVGGVNQPKKIKCLCSDGISRDQLVKGKDDLRQDAVMQQVFRVMNSLLRNDEKTARRKLHIRTYKVVPLSQRSGVIEWVKDTEPFGSYLTGTNSTPGAHLRYRPRDLIPAECRSMLSGVSKCPKEIKIQKFKEICAGFKPVFRHFFFEKYNTPGEWFDRRTAYTKSVATNSMIGYILGIGDRHVVNILMDQITAEMIHIDFGIAFEQGRILPTPETVPFRLTRDVVDGMGVSGVDGIFRRCCEETMIVLRKCQEPILTTVEVLLYDPLYAWTISPKKAFSLQEEQDGVSEQQQINFENNTSDKNVLAERALTRLKEKLEGLEDGSITSVEGQVNSLIRTARDVSNLALLFAGWQAYL